MSVINVQRRHQLSLIDLRKKIDAIIIDIGERFEFRTEWESDCLLTFRRKGASGNIKIDENKFELTLRLGMMFKSLKNVIESEVVSAVDSNLNRKE